MPQFAEKPAYSVSINGKDVTSDLTNYVSSLTYTDRVAGASDEVDIVLNNSDGRFTGDWAFTKGDTIDVAIGYGADLVPCGTFTIDQVEASGPPDAVTVRAMAAGINSPLRTKKSTAHENKTIRQIAQAVADEHGYTINDGTTFSQTIKIDWSGERATIYDAIDAILSALEVVAKVRTSEGFDSIRSLYWAAVAVAYAHTYRATLDGVIRDLSRKGKSAEAAEISKHLKPWSSIWGAASPTQATKIRPEIDNTSILQLPPELQQISDFVNGQVNYTTMVSTAPDIGKVQRNTTVANELVTVLKTVYSGLTSVDKTVTRSKLDTFLSWHTQDNESDLAYLQRVGLNYGVIFSIRGDVMIFTSTYDVEEDVAADTINRADVVTYNFSDKSAKTYLGARVSWHDIDTAEVIEAEIGDLSGDVLEIRERVESQAQADEVAKSRLHQSASNELEGTLGISGRPLLCAGCNVDLSGFGVYDGKWAVVESRHTINVDAGYMLDLTVKRGRAS